MTNLETLNNEATKVIKKINNRFNTYEKNLVKNKYILLYDTICDIQSASKEITQTIIDNVFSTKNGNKKNNTGNKNMAKLIIDSLLENNIFIESIEHLQSFEVGGIMNNYHAFNDGSVSKTFLGKLPPLKKKAGKRGGYNRPLRDDAEAKQYVESYKQDKPQPSKDIKTVALKELQHAITVAVNSNDDAALFVLEVFYNLIGASDTIVDASQPWQDAKHTLMRLASQNGLTVKEAA